MVKTFRRMLWPIPEEREDTLVQFFAIHGGLRTINIKDIIRIR